jgi:phosphohistidine phosphatase
MALYLVQHGKALSTEQDPARGLSVEGREEVERMAQAAKSGRLELHRIVHSEKLRARQTAEIFAAALQPPDGLRETPGIAPKDPVEAFAARLVPHEEWLVVSHLPFLERLAAYLICGDPEQLVVKFQNAGIVCLDRLEGQTRWSVLWALVPRLRR